MLPREIQLLETRPEYGELKTTELEQVREQLKELTPGKSNHRIEGREDFAIVPHVLNIQLR